MAKLQQTKNKCASKGNSQDSLLVIYILRILKKYSSPKNPLSSQNVMDYLNKDYSIGNSVKEKAEAQRKKVRRLLDTLCEHYGEGCIIKDEGKTKAGHKWYYNAFKDKLASEEGVKYETLSNEEIDFLIDIIASSKIINTKSTFIIVKKLLEKADISKAERLRRLRKIKNEGWPKSVKKDLALLHEAIHSCMDEVRQIRFDYEDRKAILATPYEWDADKKGNYILIAKVDGERDFTRFSIEKIKNLEKGDLDYDFDDSDIDISFNTPDALSLDSLFTNIKIINDAIKKKSTLEFEYLSYTIKDEKVTLGSKSKRVLPHNLVFNNGKYYLIGYNEEKARIDYYRVDLISKLACSDTEINISKRDVQLLDSVERAREIEKHPLMLAGSDYAITFKVVESALGRVIDAFGKKAGDLEVTDETRTVFAESEQHDERVVKVTVRTTLDEAFRWALANGDAVELVSPQDIRDSLGRVADPVYQLYTRTLSDKIRENIDYVLKEKTFKISYMVDKDTAYATYKELAKMGKLDIVDNIGISVREDPGNLDYFGEFINTERLTLPSAEHIKDMSWASRLVNVKELTIRLAQFDDISWLKEMKKLRRLYLNESPFSDLSVLSEHEEIDVLDINGTKVSDISFIKNFPKLKQLHISACPIEDYSPLLTMQSDLKYLEIDKEALAKIGEENIRNRHIGIRIKQTNDSPFWFLDI